jgi:hypothetical protein
MTPRLSSSANRGVILALALATALFLAYFSIRNAFAAHYADLQTLQGYERATRLEPDNFNNWYLLGRYWQYNLEDADAARAIRAYTVASQLSPGSADIWLDLAISFESEGNIPAAREAFLHAKRDYPISADVSWRYGNFLLRQGEVDPSLIELRHAVDVEHRRGAEAFSRALRVEPNAGKIVDRLLPLAGDVYVDVISGQVSEGHIDIAMALWDRLAASHPRLRLQDAYSLVGDLLKRKRFADAERIWDQAVVFAGFADLQEPQGSLLWDGGFESGVWGGNLTWFYPENFHAVQFGIDSLEKHSGSHSLRISFDGRYNLSLNEICHDVLVQPSTRYHFSAWVRTKELITDQGIRFQLLPLDAKNPTEVVTSEIHGSEPWQLVETSWLSGEDVHEMQVCILRYPSDQEGHRIRGIAWIDDVALVPESTERAKP